MGHPNVQSITIIHSVEEGFPATAGGIASWIKDFIEFSKAQHVILGVGRGPKPAARNREKQRAEFFRIATLRNQRRLVPDSLRLACGIFWHREKIGRNVLVHQIELVPVVKIAQPQSKITLVLHTNYSAHLGPHTDSTWRFSRTLFPFLERIALKLADGVISHSPQDLDRIRKLAPETILIPGWFNDRIFFNTETIGNPSVVLWVGRFERVKDPILAIDTVAQLRDEINLEFIMIGSGSMEGVMRRRIHELGLERKIKIVAPLIATDLAAELEAASALLHTSHFEGSPRVLLEALAVGTPVITLPSCDPEGLILPGKNGLLADKRSPTELAALLRKRKMFKDKSEITSATETHRASSVVSKIEALIS